MDIKKITQYSLLVLLFVTSFLFYNEYFTDEVKQIDNNVSQNVIERKLRVILMM